MKKIQEIKKAYKIIRPVIRKRLAELALNWNKPDRHVFAELAFCLCTPLSKAVHCNAAVNELEKTKVLFTGDAETMKQYMGKVRFNRNKSRYIVEAREFFTEGKRLRIKKRLDVENVCTAREWLVANVKGLGYKEASHFLRNLGFGKDLSILDVHVLKNLKELGIISSIPGSVSRKQYLDIEGRMKKFARSIKIPLIELDLLLWYSETGKIVK